MKSTTSLYTTLLFLLPWVSSFSQECGTTVSENDLRVISELKNNQISSNVSRDLGDGLVPVKYHIIAMDDSTMAMDTALMYAEMDIVAQRFAGAGIEFYQCGEIDYIYDSDYVDFEKTESEDICDLLDVPDVLNIWFADNVYKMDDGDVVSICGYAYLSGPNDRIIIDNGCADNTSTLPHEIGHYFSLLHTHSSSGLGDELVDGSNCSDAGDLLCDTPADPKLSSSVVSSNCEYVGTDVDDNGDTYEPDTENLMSYSRKHCRIEFSDEQLDQMQAYLISYRNYLTCPTSTSTGHIEASNPSASLFPSAFVDVLTLNYTTVDANETISVIIYNMMGQLESSFTWTQHFPGNHVQQLTGLNALNTGFHIVQIRNGNLTTTNSLLKL